MSSSINFIYSFHLSSNISRLINQLTPDQKQAARNTAILTATTTKYVLRPNFLVQLANVLNGSNPDLSIKEIPEVYSLLIQIQDTATALTILNGTELSILASDSKIVIQSTPKKFVPRNQPRPEREIPTNVNHDELQKLVDSYIRLVYPTFLCNMVTSAIATLEQNNLLLDTDLANTSLRNMILFNIASGINVNKRHYDELVTPGLKSNINLFYFSNFHPNSPQQDLTLGTLALIRHHVIQTPHTYRHILDTSDAIIGSSTFVNGKSGALLKSEIGSKIKVNIKLFSSIQQKAVLSSTQVDYSDLIIEGIDNIQPLSQVNFKTQPAKEETLSESDGEFTFDGSR